MGDCRDLRQGTRLANRGHFQHDLRVAAMTKIHMPRVAGIDHLVLSVCDFGCSKAFYGKLLGCLGFELKYSYPEMAGWSNGKTLFWIAAADAEGKRRRYRKGDIGFH